MEEAVKQEWVRLINMHGSITGRADYVYMLVRYGFISHAAGGELLVEANRDRNEVKRFDLPPKDGPFIGPVQEVAPTPPPKAEPSLCPCGAELMGNLAKRVNLKCGDCAMAEALPGRPRTSLDQRIAEAQPPKVDKDPTEAWGAGQTPGYEWP